MSDRRAWSAKQAGVEPKAYLKAMAGAAIRGGEFFLPHEYAHEAADRQE